MLPGIVRIPEASVMLTRSRGLSVGLFALLWGVSCASTSGKLSGGLPEAPAAGKSSTKVAGCLSGGSRTEGDDWGQAGADVMPIPGGVLVTHRLIHGCGLKAHVTASTEREMVIIREHLTGPITGCDCPSILKTTVGLSPGPWIVRLLLDTPTSPDQIVQDWDVVVRPR